MISPSSTARKKPPNLAIRGLNPPKEKVEETTVKHNKLLCVEASIAALAAMQQAQAHWQNQSRQTNVKNKELRWNAR
ncbi:MAG: hypothetical protein CFE44_28705 [Burkholderiales bacterium PBB4]|nr:MAG: hypothetical protein CFE44_28705 [Burkholderiales bacterium PBB4]